MAIAPLAALLPLPAAAWLPPSRWAVPGPVVALTWGCVSAAAVMTAMTAAGAYVGYHYGVPETEVAGNLTGWPGARKTAGGWAICFGVPAGAGGFVVGGLIGWALPAIRRRLTSRPQTGPGRSGLVVPQDAEQDGMLSRGGVRDSPGRRD